MTSGIQESNLCLLISGVVLVSYLNFSIPFSIDYKNKNCWFIINLNI